MPRLALHWKIIIGLITGIIFALLTSYFGKIELFGLNWSGIVIDWIGPFGKIFINLLKLIAIPLVLFSIIKGVSDLSDIKKIGAIGFKTLGLYVITTLIAVGLGLSLVNSIKPGERANEELRLSNRINYELWAEKTGIPTVDGKTYLTDPQHAELVASIRTENETALVDSSVIKKINKSIANSSKRAKKGPLQILVDVVPSNVFDAFSGQGMMLQVIFFAIFFGIVMLMVDKEKTSPIKKLFDGLNEVFLKMIEVVMRFAPFFVFALLAGKMSEMAPNDPGKIIDIFASLFSYSLVVVLGLLIMIFVFYPLMLKLLVKGLTYVGFFKAIGKAQNMAFSTSSSAATLPVTMDCVNNNLNVPKEISSFVLPIGATVNMDGTSLYISVAVVFLAQFHLIDLTVGQQLTIVATATLASIGASAVPSAGLIMMIMVLQSVGLNPAWIAIIFPVDRILDMCRTVVNVTGDASVAKVIAFMEEKKLKKTAPVEE